MSENPPTKPDDALTGENNKTAADGSIAKEIDSVLPGSNPLGNLKARQTGPVQYSVMSARNGGVTMHRVNIQEPSCTCEDWEYNLEDGQRNICAHMAKALLVSPTNGDAESMGVAQLYHVTSRLQDKLEDLEQEAEILKGHATSAGTERRSKEASDGADTDESSSTGVDAEDAAERLRNAYSDVGIEIETTIDVDSDSGQERIWVETVEQISEGKFSAFIQDPDELRYDPDEKDGYQNNWVAPRDVEGLIEEVF